MFIEVIKCKQLVKDLPHSSCGFRTVTKKSCFTDDKYFVKKRKNRRKSILNT